MTNVQVHMLVRGGHMRASGAMQDRVEAHKKINVLYNTQVEDAFGDGRGLTGLHIHNTDSGAPARRPLPCYKRSVWASVHAVCASAGSYW